MLLSQQSNSTLILGAHGFLGSALCRLFDQQQSPYLKPSSKSLDLCASSAIASLENMAKSVSSIIFLSAVTPDRNRTLEAQAKNLSMINNLVEAFKTSKTLSHITYVSSDAVYGPTEHHINETTTTRPDSPYGEMHLQRERAISKLNIPTAILRPTMLYGHSDSHTSYGASRLINEAICGPVSIFGRGEEYRDYIHVEDAAEFVYHASHQKMAGVWNLASGRSHTFSALASLIETCQDTPLEIKYLERKQAITHKHFDTQKLKDTFPACSIRPIETGISQILEQYNRDHG
jgi:nucleoside-diphosphate-sugar epimerase